MSFIITVYVREGIVMASDSRLTLTATQKQEGQTPPTRMVVGISDSNYRTFLAPNNIGISTYGAADVQGMPITSSVEAFIREHLSRAHRQVDEVPEMLLKHFQKLANVSEIGFHVAGYKMIGNQRVQQVWQVGMKTGEVKQVNENYHQGATWGGEADILVRLLQPVWVKDAGDNFQAMPTYAIPWQFFTLQDGVDFAVYALRTTIDSIRFQPRPKTVGGPIDVLVIKPDNAFWVQHKELRIS